MVVIARNNMYFKVFNRYSTIFSTKTCCNGIFVCENKIDFKLITLLHFLQCVQHVLCIIHVYSNGNNLFYWDCNLSIY